MELKEIAVVSGKPGLFKIIKPAVSGVILEAMDGSSSRFIAGSSTKVSVLGEISVYTEDGENIPLLEVFKNIYIKHGKELTYGVKSSDQELRNFFVEVVPNHDRQRVYNSDIKKVTQWYSILINNGFEQLFAQKEEQKVEEPSTEVKKEKKPKKEATPTEALETEKAKEPKKETKAGSKKQSVATEESESTSGEKKAAAKASAKKNTKNG